MRLAGIDDALELGVRQDAIRDDVGRQMRPIGRLWRCDRSHRRRLHELRRMRLRAGNADRLQGVGFIKRVGDLAGIGGRPVDGRHRRLPSPRGRTAGTAASPADAGDVGADGSGR